MMINSAISENARKRLLQIQSALLHERSPATGVGHVSSDLARPGWNEQDISSQLARPGWNEQDISSQLARPGWNEKDITS
jgi:hypothetical protein